MSTIHELAKQMLSEPDEDITPHPKFDVVIYSAYTGIVSSVAGFGLADKSFGERHSSEELVHQLDNLLAVGMIAEAVPWGTLNAGDKMPVTEKCQQYLAKNPKRIVADHRKAIYDQRKANCQCVMCGSPNLVTDTFCEECAAKSAARTGKAKSGSPI